ncbi:MAG TPA: DUF4214 domain-containing protein, partial [Pyrinomonadaceae bacterium]|nr:DUF4214 domain-containing protein [Pyrinomonadaceae bacterium]
GRGVVIGQPGADALLEANKAAFFNEFVTRQAFQTRYPLSMSHTQYVNSLNANTGNSLSPGEAADLANRLIFGLTTRARALREIAENAEFGRRHKNRAFVMMQYFGYMRREPDDAGFTFWFGKLNNHNGDFISAEMVRSFIISGEYIGRFGQP